MLWLRFGPHARAPDSGDGHPATSAVIVAAFDCAANAVRYESMTTYHDDFKNTMSADDIPAKRRLWGPVEAGSYDDDELRMACSKGND